MEDGRNGQCGTSAALRVVKVKGQGRVNVTAQHRCTEVACVMAIRVMWTLVTSDLVQVRLSRPLDSMCFVALFY